MFECFALVTCYNGRNRFVLKAGPMKFLLTLKNNRSCETLSVAHMVSGTVRILNVHSALGMIEVDAQPDDLAVLKAMNIFESIEPVSNVKLAPPGSEIQ